MAHPDEHYITTIRSGDPEGLRRIYRDYLPKVAGLITQNGGSYDDAKDVFQDALVVLFEKCRHGGFVLSSTFATLIYGVCRNIWGNRLQKKSRTEVTLSDDFKFSDETDLEFNLIEEEKDRIFRDALFKIGEDCRRLLLLFFEKRSMEEIAAAMGFGSVGYAKKRKFQCKESLLEKVRGDVRYAEFLDE